MFQKISMHLLAAITHATGAASPASASIQLQQEERDFVSGGNCWFVSRRYSVTGTYKINTVNGVQMPNASVMVLFERATAPAEAGPSAPVLH